MNIVIIGGGFCGSLCARKLEKKFNVTLIDTTEYFEFTPSVPNALCDSTYGDKIQVLHKNYLKYAKVIISKVDYIGDEYVRIKGIVSIDPEHLLSSHKERCSDLHCSSAYPSAAAQEICSRL